MKKSFTLSLITLMVLILTLTSISSNAENLFDASVYEKGPNYRYDKFDKQWRTLGAYLKRYSDATSVLGLQIGGDDDRVIGPPFLYFWFRDTQNKEIVYQIEQIQILVGDDVFTAESVLVGDSDSQLPLDSKRGKALLIKMTEVEGISVKLKYKTGSIVEEINSDQYSELKELARLIVDNDAWEYVQSEDLPEEGKDVWDECIQNNWPLI